MKKWTCKTHKRNKRLQRWMAKKIHKMMKTKISKVKMINSQKMSSKMKKMKISTMLMIPHLKNQALRKNKRKTKRDNIWIWMNFMKKIFFWLIKKFKIQLRMLNYSCWIQDNSHMLGWMKNQEMESISYLILTNILID